MNIINKVTLKCMKQNKKRTIVTIFGVIICVAMISAVCLIASSFQSAMVAYSETKFGTYEARFTDLNRQQCASISKESSIKDAMRLGIVGEAEYDGFQSDQNSMTLLSTDLNHLELYGASLVQGKLPETAEEILIPKGLMEQKTFPYQIGDRIDLNIGSYEFNDEEMEFQKGTSKTFVITGIVDYGMGAMFTGNMIYNLLIPFDETMIRADSYSVTMTFQNEQEIYDELYRMSEEYQAYHYSENASLLMYKGISNSSMLVTLIMVCTFLGLIILIGGVSLIYNAFSISLSERSRYLGMLSSVGATRKQKRQSVMFEAGVIGVIAIPLGLFFGIVGVTVTFYLLNPITKNILDEAFELKPAITIWCILIPIAFSILVLALSAWLPAVKASRISAISAIRQTDEFKIRKRDVHTSKWTKKLFGIEAELGLKNTKRNHSRYLATLFSLIVCIVLFMSATYFSSAMKHSLMMVQNSIDADFIVDFYMSNRYENSKLNDHVMEQLKNVSAAQSSKLFSEQRLDVNDQLSFTKDAVAYLEEEKELNQLSDDEFHTIYPPLNLQVLDDDLFQEYCKEAGIKETTMNQQVPAIILINERTIRMHKTDTYSNMKILSNQQGDTIQFHQTIQNEDGEMLNEVQDLYVAQITDIVPSINKGHADYLEVIAVMNMSNLELLNQQLLDKGQSPVADFFEVQYLSEDSDALSEEVNQILEENSEVINASTMNISGQRQKDEQQYLFVSVFLYGFVVLILLICMANIMNTIVTSVSLRKREFAMIKSIGITTRKFNKMIMYETMFYGMKATLYGVPLGLLMTMLMNRMFGHSFLFEYAYPWINILVIVLGVFVMLGITMSYAIHKIRKDNIVETIRNESI